MTSSLPPEAEAHLAPQALPPEAEAALVQDPWTQGVKGLLAVKYAVLLAYVTYGDQLRTLSRDGVHKHFQDHVADELDWIYQLHRNLASAKEASYPQGVSVPTVPLGTERPMLEALLALETQALEGWMSLSQIANDAQKNFAQEGARVQLSHREDLLRYLGAE